MFYRRVEAIANTHASAVSVVFACTLAHELGHVLMPERAHSPQGLMRATLNREELQQAEQGQLHFMPDDVASILGRHRDPAATFLRP